MGEISNTKNDSSKDEEISWEEVQTILNLDDDEASEPILIQHKPTIRGKTYSRRKKYG